LPGELSIRATFFKTPLAPLPEIFDALIVAVSNFGPQKDDRTVLLVRILANT
jgi:hypothetical protein